MTMTLTHAATLVAGLAMIASQFAIARNGLLRSLAAAVGLAIVAAGLIHAIAA
jgi:hypothetical protein